MTFVVDGEPVGTMWVVNPIDVYFLAILQARSRRCSTATRRRGGRYTS